MAQTLKKTPLVFLLSLATIFSWHSALAKKNETKKQALIVVSSHGQLGNTGKETGWYLSEVTHVYYPLIKAGYAVEFASPQGGAAPMDPSSKKLDDPDNKRFVEDAKIMKQITSTLPLADVNPKKYQIVHFAGGHGVMWDFADNKDISRITAGIYENNGIVSAVCHGPAALVNVKLSNGDYLVKGKDVTGFTNAEEEAVGLTKVVPFLLETTLKERGAIFHAGQLWEDKVMVSERLVTGQNPQSAHSVGKKIIELTKKLK